MRVCLICAAVVIVAGMMPIVFVFVLCSVIRFGYLFRSVSSRYPTQRDGFGWKFCTVLEGDIGRGYLCIMLWRRASFCFFH